MVSALVVVATAAAKWLTVAKIITTVGTGILMVAPVIEEIKSKKERG